MKVFASLLFSAVALLSLACASEPTHTVLPSPTLESTATPAPTPEIGATVQAEAAATLAASPTDTPTAMPSSPWVTWQEVRKTQLADGLPEGRPRVVTYGVGSGSPDVAYGLRVEWRGTTQGPLGQYPREMARWHYIP